MPSPIEIEQLFQNLKHSLALLSSNRMKLLRMLEFFEPLLTYDAFLAAYGAELFPSFSTLVTSTDFTGTDPVFLERLTTLLKHFEGTLPQSSYGILEGALEHLESENQKIAQWSRERQKGDIISRPDRVNGVWIPLVECETLLSETISQFATLQLLRVEVRFAPKSAKEDELHGDQLLANGASNDHLMNAVLAAKHLLRVFARIETRRYLIVRWSLNKSAHVTGESLEAGLAAALFIELLRLYQCREEFALRHDVAITGRVDAEGNLLPVDERGVRLKIEACTYSWVRYIVVPKNHEAGLVAGKSDKPADKLADVPATSVLSIERVANLTDLFYNRRLTDSWRVPRMKQVVRMVWRQRRPIAAAMFLVLLAVIWKLWYGPLDREPVELEFRGEMMLFENKHGETLEEYNIGFDFPGYFGGGPFDRYCALLDVDGDGIEEAVWMQPSAQGAGSWIVCCKALGEDSLRWEVSLQRKLVFPAQGETAENFRARMILAGDFDADGSGEVIVITYHDHFPSYVMALDASTGAIKSTYVHVGHLSDGVAADLDDDGIQEILLCGINNAFNEACLVVLDPRFMEGHGPLTEAYRVEGFDQAYERAYILIPKTILGNAIPIERYNRGNKIEVHVETRDFRLAVDDQKEDPKYMGTVYGLFGFDLRPKSFTTGSDYDVSTARLFSERRISRYPDKAYFDNFKKTLRYWDGDSWQTRPTVNKRWLEAVRKLK